MSFTVEHSHGDPCTFERLSRNQQNLLSRYSSHDKVLRPTAPISVNWIPIRRISGIVPVDELRWISRFPREDDPLPTHLPFSFAICFDPWQQKAMSSCVRGLNFHSTNTNDGNRPPTMNIYSSYRFRRVVRLEGKEPAGFLVPFSISTIAYLRRITIRSILIFIDWLSRKYWMKFWKQILNDRFKNLLNNCIRHNNKIK